MLFSTLESAWGYRGKFNLVGDMKSKLAVLQFTGMVSFKYGSLEQYVVQVGAFCRELGYQTCLQYEKYPSSEKYINELKAQHIKLVCSPTYTNPIRCLWNCFRLIASVRPDVIHVYFASRYAKMAIPWLAKLFSVKRVVCMVLTDAQYKGRHLSRFMYHHYDHVLPVSNAVKQGLLVCGVDEKNMQTHYMGLFGVKKRSQELNRQLREKYSIPSEALVMMNISFDAWAKGNDIFLEAFKSIYTEFPNLYLVNVGVDPQVSGLPGMAKELAVSDRVRWVGIVDEGWKMMSMADFYVQPSRSEGLPLTIMEAMAVELPVVATNVSGNIEAVVDGQTGIVSEPDAEGLADGIRKMIGRRSHWAVFSKNAFDYFAEHFDGARSVETLVMKYYLHSTPPEDANVLPVPAQDTWLV